MHKNINHNSHKDFFVRKEDYFQKGQRIVYEGEEAEVIKATPFLVIKTANRLICGALNDQCDPRREKNLHN
jgi:hypothetical protein